MEFENWKNVKTKLLRKTNYLGVFEVGDHKSAVGVEKFFDPR